MSSASEFQKHNVKIQLKNLTCICFSYYIEIYRCMCSSLHIYMCVCVCMNSLLKDCICTGKLHIVSYTDQWIFTRWIHPSNLHWHEGTDITSTLEDPLDVPFQTLPAISFKRNHHSDFWGHRLGFRVAYFCSLYKWNHVVYILSTSFLSVSCLWDWSM